MIRPPIIRARFEGELVVDSFAGGGGASTGIEAAIGRPVDIAINHSAEAIAMHAANHPQTRHFQENIWEVDPVVACSGRPVGLAWFSPDCTHFSRAKGTTPLRKETRGLAWVVIRWASAVRPRVICLENVEEFQTWGPLGPDNRPDPARVGETFREWLGELSALGYSIEFRSLVAADYGTPTTRKRLFLIARRDGQRGAWPDATHGQGRAEAWRPAADVIDWSIPCPSIFDRARPLADATLRRIAVGLRRYVIDAARPFIIPLTHGGDARVHSIDEPVRTITAAHRGELALVAPGLVQTGYGERKGQTPRALDIRKPLGTVVAGGSKHALVTAHLMSYYGQSIGRQITEPVPTVLAGGGGHHSLVAALITKHYGGVVGHGADRTLGTITSKDHHAVSAAFLAKLYGTSTAASVEEPCPTVTSGGGRGGGHLAAVRAFLARHGGGSGEATVTIDGEAYAIVDVGMRMLQPAELFRAQGFPADYQICPDFNGRPLTKTAQTALAGNSVCPQVAEALVGANALAA